MITFYPPKKGSDVLCLLLFAAGEPTGRFPDRCIAILQSVGAVIDDLTIAKLVVRVRPCAINRNSK